MRVRTADRRAAIIETAMEVFREVGYERASMAAISARVGGSKATLYGYFKSKEELFAAAMISVMEGQAQDAIALLDAANPDVVQVLTDFGLAYLALLTSSETVSLVRIAVAEGANSDLGARLYALGPERSWKDIASYLAQLQDRKFIRQADPHVAAAHLKGLLEAGTIEPLLFGADAWFRPIDAVTRAVQVFLMAYGLHGH
ncbi:TetR/AcrR family transcriptional regulator [Sphingobium sp.]|uniref:TetR/AcrR family transcriptional regulator n=1 Tax=Sphingobium sp. TaxID=1912891 RepID=UPI0028BE0420|nr:TetR/AcrR family transcriptional regulator [Sphingobium sp.]